MDVLGLDPAPGDPGQVRALAGQAHARAAALAEVATRLGSLHVAPWWGVAAGAFAAEADGLPRAIREASGAFAEVGHALDDYADALAEARARVVVLRRAADDAAARARSARADRARLELLAASRPAVGDAEAGAAVLRERDAAARAGEAAEGDLRAARREAARVAAELTAAGGAAARRVLAAGDRAPGSLPLPPLTAGPRGDGDGLLDVVRGNAEPIRVATEVLAVVGLAAGVAALVPAVPVVGAVALTATLAGAGLNTLLAVAGEKAPAELWPDVLAVVTFGAGRALAGSAEVASRSRFTISRSRVDAGLPLADGRGDLPSALSRGTEFSDRELLVRSVKFAVEAPNAVVGTVSGVTSAQSLARRATGSPPTGERRGDAPAGAPR